jgi:MATE family multidrug resistance protein
MALASGILGEKELVNCFSLHFLSLFQAAQSIVATACNLIYMIPLGVSIVGTTKIGNAIGANLPGIAKSYVKAVIVIGLIIGVADFTLFFSVRSVWGYIWTQDEEVVSWIAKVTPNV